nr:serine hydrolase domain-containing protein [Actinopolymorpha rutila]
MNGWRRRASVRVVATIALVGTVLVAVLASIPPPARADARSRGFDHPYEGFAPPGTRLRAGTPKEAGLDAAELTTMVEDLRGYLRPQGDGHPLYPGAVVLVAREGKVVVHEAMGQAVKYADASGAELPVHQQAPMTPDTIFDLASISKLFTSIVVMQQVEAGRVNLDAPVANYLPEFATNGKEPITVRQLLTHTSGLPSWMRLWRPYPDRASRIAAVLAVKPSAPPGTTYVYSDLNLITLGILVERVTGRGLDELVRAGITEPLGMVDTGYNPPADKLHRVAATEFQSDPDRGMVRGSVHDENAWSLGGVAGHAGVFSTASDLAILAQAMMNGGSYAGRRVLGEKTVTAMLTDLNEGFPGHAHGLGFELDQRFYMGALSSPRTAGHTGFTGTSVVIDLLSRSIAVLTTNRVHPRREWSSVNVARRTVADHVARALDVTPRRGRTAWYAGHADDVTATLTLPVTLREEHTRLGFDLFVDTEVADVLTLELSRDGGTTWSPLPYIVSSRGRIANHDGSISGFTGRHWQQAYAEVDESPGQVQIRWRYVTDPLYQGRGVYVDEVRLGDAQGTLFNGEREADRFLADGWSQATR